MERLTFDGNFCDICMCQGQYRMTSECADGDCSQKKVWERLKEYEDTGLEPGEIRALARDAAYVQTHEATEALNKAVQAKARGDYVAAMAANLLVSLKHLTTAYGIGDKVRELMEPKSSFQTNG